MLTNEQGMLQELLDFDPADEAFGAQPARRMNDWEVEFVESLARLSPETELSRKQQAKLREIWGRIFV